MKLLSDWIRRPFYIEVLLPYLNRPGVNVLDVGCGNDAPARFKRYYPHSRYYGCDFNENPYRPEYRRLMEAYYKVNLENLEEMEQIPGGFFDVIIINHVVEHITNADQVIPILASKLNSSGVIYIETPSERSLKLPSMRGTLNFYDDPTHIKLWSFKTLKKIAYSSGIDLIAGGRRRSKKRIILFPLYLVINVLQRRPAGAFWDLLGFANYLVGRKI